MIPIKLYLTEEDYQIADKHGIPRKYARNRFNGGWSAERATTEPIGTRDKYKRLQQEAKANGIEININTLKSRIHLGWSEQDAVTTQVKYRRYLDVKAESPHNSWF